MSSATSAHKTKPKKPTTSFERTLRDVGHLLRRAGFGDTPDNVQAAAEQGLKATVDRLVGYSAVQETLSPPNIADMSDRKTRIEPLTQWWVGHMLTTQRPFQEKMVLFWHNHFATAWYKVRRVDYMYGQNQLFRDNALGRLDDILNLVFKDPAMMIWLDGQRNTKQAPNENYGREVMELFTLGRATGDTPNYTEDDVHASARAFTGWRLDDTGNVTLVPRLHDDSAKTLLGQTGNWGAEDANRIFAAHPATARFLSTKLWQFFASDDPPAAAITRMAQAYTNSNHSIEAVVRAMLASPEFYSHATRTGHIKSPTDFVVSTYRQLGLTASAADLAQIPRVLALLGQELFNPVNVGGWPGGPSWINASTMLGRFNWASRLTGEAPGGKGALDGGALVTASGADNTAQLLYFITNTLGITMSATTQRALLQYVGKGTLDDVDGATKAQGLVQLALVSPEYQIA